MPRSIPAYLQDPRWTVATKHTAMCDECEKRKHDFTLRCNVCGYKVCSGCYQNSGCDFTHMTGGPRGKACQGSHSLQNASSVTSPAASSSVVAQSAGNDDAPEVFEDPSSATQTLRAQQPLPGNTEANSNSGSSTAQAKKAEPQILSPKAFNPVDKATQSLSPQATYSTDVVEEHIENHQPDTSINLSNTPPTSGLDVLADVALAAERLATTPPLVPSRDTNTHLTSSATGPSPPTPITFTPLPGTQRINFKMPARDTFSELTSNLQTASALPRPAPRMYDPVRDIDISQGDIGVTRAEDALPSSSSRKRKLRSSDNSDDQPTTPQKRVKSNDSAQTNSTPSRKLTRKATTPDDASRISSLLTHLRAKPAKEVELFYSHVGDLIRHYYSETRADVFTAAGLMAAAGFDSDVPRGLGQAMASKDLARFMVRAWEVLFGDLP